MKHIRRILTVLLLFTVLLFCSCTSTRKYDSSAVYLTDTSSFSLLSTSSMETPYESYQLITGSFMGGDPMAFEAYILCDSSVIDISLFSSTGQSIATLIYTDEGITFSSAFISTESLRAEYVIADIQLLLYPLKPLQDALSSSGLLLSEREEGSSIVRTLHDGDEVIWYSVQEPHHIRVENLLRNYSYDIEVLS